MPALQNAKHERFAQELAKGKTADEAYALAGYKADRGNASRLTAKDSVQARLAEIQEKVAVRTEITVAGITDRLLAIATKGEGKDDAPMLGVARAALMDAAKLNGLVTDKQEIKHSGGIGMTPSEREARIAELEAKRRDRGGGNGVRAPAH